MWSLLTVRNVQLSCCESWWICEERVLVDKDEND